MTGMNPRQYFASECRAVERAIRDGAQEPERITDRLVHLHEEFAYLRKLTKARAERIYRLQSQIKAKSEAAQ